jgi:hypothetical protein
MKRHLSVMAVCVALAAPLPALAQSKQGDNPWYTYADGRLVMLDPDGPGDSLEGLRVGGSMVFQQDIFGIANLTLLDDYTQLDFGIGLSHPLSASTDLVGTAGITWAEYEAGPFDDDDTGIFLNGGVRSMMGPQFELGGYVGYAETFGDGDILLTGEALLHMSRELALVASLGLSDDYSVLTFGARWNVR